MNEASLAWALQRSNVPLATPDKFTHPSDHLVLEDESGRVKLAGDSTYPPMYVTGWSHFCILQVP